MALYFCLYFLAAHFVAEQGNPRLIMPPPPQKPGEQVKNTERNEYIPAFIANKPFYIDDAIATQDDYLEHQRLQGQKNSDPIATAKWYERGKKAAPAATKYRKGACENCGAMTHKAKDCLQRKRKHGAKWTGKDIQADEHIQQVKLGYDAKRDRWNGYDPSEYQAVVDEYHTLEEMKRQTRGEGEGGGEQDEEGNDEGDKYDAETDMGRKQATSTRQLRLREDTAKYLLNLDLESAQYDPKTRRLKDEDPAGLESSEEFARAAGDAAEFERAQRYAWESAEKGTNALHLQANPTAGEVIRKKEEKESREKKEEQRRALLEKYGGQEHIGKNPLKEAAVIENERFVEYDAKGRLKGEANRKEKSMYAEDVFINNHTSVWGSWWKEFKWGYACCHSTVKNSYCIGEEGRRAIEESAAFSRGDTIAEDDSAEGQSVAVPDGLAAGEDASPDRRVPNAADHPAKVKKDEVARAKRTLDEMEGGGGEAGMEEHRKRKQDAAATTA